MGSMLNVVDALRSGVTLADLTAGLAIKVSRHGKHPNLVLLKYNQINSPMGDPIVQECRGLILDEADDWRPISFPFKKFFNEGEGFAAPIDWPTAKVLTKLDGSLCTLYPYKGSWWVSTSGTADAGGPVYGLEFTFADLFHRTWLKEGYSFPDSNVCVMFELTGPANRVVVPYKEPSLTMLGARDMDSLEEIPLGDGRFNYRKVQSHPLGSLVDVLKTFDTLEGLHNEGYVVVDSRFNRIKVKHPGYVALHHLAGGISPKAMLEIVRKGESTEFLSYFPEYKPEFDRVSGLFRGLVSEAGAEYERLKDIPDQKSFALEALKTRPSHALFAMRKGKPAAEYYRDIHIDTLMRELGLKHVEREVE